MPLQKQKDDSDRVENFVSEISGAMIDQFSNQEQNLIIKSLINRCIANREDQIKDIDVEIHTYETRINEMMAVGKDVRSSLDDLLAKE